MAENLFVDDSVHKHLSLTWLLALLIFRMDSLYGKPSENRGFNIMSFGSLLLCFIFISLKMMISKLCLANMYCLNISTAVKMGFSSHYLLVLFVYAPPFLFVTMSIGDSPRIIFVTFISLQSSCVRRPKFIVCTGSNVSGHIPTYTSQSTASR